MSQGKLETEPECPTCGAILNGWTGQDVPPIQDDVSVCAYCSTLLIFDGEPLTLREATTEEVERIVEEQGQELLDTLQAVREWRREVGR